MLDPSHLPLGGMDVETFLRDYWQKRPLLIRDALPADLCPITPEELAGLACEEEANARLVLEKGGSRPWELRHGPFTETDFTRLPADHWSLLVTDIEKLIPDFMAVRDRFRFIPDWRIDDLMMSYAPPGGSVGPHVDQYDVFLIQMHGHRRWMIEDAVREEEALIDGIPLRILREFDPDEDWVLAPGDMLYLPPGIPHHGVAEDRCMTLSVGFRAPTHADLVSGVLDYVIDPAMEATHYADPDLRPQTHPGEIGGDARARVRELIRSSLAVDDRDLDRFFGRFITDRPVDLMHLYPPPENLGPDAFRALLEEQETMERNPAARFAWFRAGDTTYLYADGEEYPFSAADTAAVEYLCAEREYAVKQVVGLSSRRFIEVLTELFNRGCIG